MVHGAAVASHGSAVTQSEVTGAEAKTFACLNLNRHSKEGLIYSRSRRAVPTPETLYSCISSKQHDSKTKAIYIPSSKPSILLFPFLSHSRHLHQNIQVLDRRHRHPDMCVFKSTFWACHRCGQLISNAMEPRPEWCLASKEIKQCSSAVVNVIVACDPALCLICGFHKQDRYREVERRIKDMERVKGLFVDRRVPLFWGLDPGSTWQAVQAREQRRIAYGECRGLIPSVSR